MIALTYTETYLRSLKPLTIQEKGLVQEFICEFMDSKKGNGISLEPLQKVKTKGLWSGRVSRDLRMILFKGTLGWKLLHVGHHDEAYTWASRKHFIEGDNNQLIVEQIEWKIIEKTTEHVVSPPLFVHLSKEYLSEIGFPEESITSIHELRTEEHLLEFIDQIPSKFSDILLNLYDGKIITPDNIKQKFSIPQTHGTILESTMNSFKTDGILPNCMVYITDEQRDIIEKNYDSPIWVVGTAGTGKTIIGIHRAIRLAKEGHSVTLVTTNTFLSQKQQELIEQFCGKTPHLLEKINCTTTIELLREYASKKLANIQILDHNSIYKPFYKFCEGKVLPAPFHNNPQGLLQEWHFAIDRWGCQFWNDFKNLSRTGRVIPLSLEERLHIWNFWYKFRKHLQGTQNFDIPMASYFATEYIQTQQIHQRCIIIDEAQDLEQSQIKFIQALTKHSNYPIFLIGDYNQRVLPHEFSPNMLGMNLQYIELKTCHRTTAHIQRYSERVLKKASIADVTTLETGVPVVEISSQSEEDEAIKITETIKQWNNSGIPFKEILVVRRFQSRTKTLYTYLSTHFPTCLMNEDKIQFASAISCKGLEFTCVIFVGVEKKLFPQHKSYLEGVDLIDHIQRERNFLYIGLTRATKKLAVSWIGERTMFLEDT